MSGELDQLARAAADALVAAMTADSWDEIERGFAAVIGLERRMDAAHGELAASSAEDRERLLHEQARAWTTRLRDVLDDDPAAVDGLRVLLTELGTVPPAVTQQAKADHGSQAVTIGGSITSNTGEVYVGVGKVDKRTVNRFFAPFVFLGRAVRQAAAAHAVTTAIVSVILILAVAAVGGWRAHWPSAVFGAAKPRAATVAWKPLAWTSAAVRMPAGAAGGGLSAVSCAAAGTCVVAGGYSNKSGHYGILVETVSHGRWAPRMYEPTAPAGSADFPVNAVACPAPGNCLTAGEYFDSTSGRYTGLVATLSGGAWTASSLSLPADAGQDQETELHSLACPAPGNCVAVGSIYVANASPQRGLGLIQTLRDRTWTPVDAPLPADAASGDQSNGNLYGVACPAPGNCVAVGFYDSTANGTQGLVDTLRNGTWTATSVPLPAASGSAPWLNAVSCTTVSSCVAVGWASGHGLIETLSHQTWHAVTAPLPKGAVSKYGVQLQSVACPASGACLAVGYYNADSKASTSYGFIDTLANGKWTAAMAPPSGSAGQGGKGPALWGVGCATTSFCVAAAGSAIESTVRIGASLTASAATASPSPVPSPTDSSELSSGPVAPGHDTPQNAVDGLMQAELAGDWTQACSYLVPTSQAACDQQAPQLPAFTGTATVDGAVISGSEALVEVTGSMCSGNSGCNSSSDPSVGMPNDQVTFQQAYDQVTSNGNSSLSPVPCIQDGGQWYVNATP